METEIVFCFVFVDGNQFQYQYIENSIIVFSKFYKNKSDFFCDIFIFILEKLGLVEPVKLKIKLVWYYLSHGAECTMVNSFTSVSYFATYFTNL